MGAHRDLGGPLAVHLVDIASDRGPVCTADDLSTAVVRSSEAFGLEMWRRGYAAAVSDMRAREEAEIEDRPTARMARPPAESGTRPVAVDEDATPIEPIDVRHLRASSRTRQ